MKFAIVIPTYNRVEQLKTAIKHIEKQVTDESIDLYCVISNTASTDGTHQFLSNLKSDKIKFVIHSSLESNVHMNWRKSAEILPNDIEWVWFHGDDDFLYVEAAVQFVCDQIRSLESPNLSIVHACQANRSRGTGSLVRGNLVQMCNQIGYHELLGWMSSLVIRADRFKTAILGFEPLTTMEEIKLKKISAYAHSCLILEQCHADEILFIDLPLVNPQDQEQTPESIQRWAAEETGPRYFYVVDDMISLRSKGILSSGLSRVFFRYLNGYFWDRYVIMILSDLVTQKGMSVKNKDNLERLRSISDMLSLPSDKKHFLELYKSVEEKIISYLNALDNLEKNQDSISKFFTFVVQPAFTFQIFDENGRIQR